MVRSLPLTGIVLINRQLNIDVSTGIQGVGSQHKFLSFFKSTPSGSVDLRNRIAELPIRSIPLSEAVVGLLADPEPWSNLNLPLHAPLVILGYFPPGKNPYMNPESCKPPRTASWQALVEGVHAHKEKVDLGTVWYLGAPAVMENYLSGKYFTL
jgi:hypothetical protein